MSKHLFVGIPAYDGRVVVENFQSFFASIPYLQKEGVILQVEFCTGNPYVAQARNLLAARFLQSKASRLLYIDSDLGFDSDAITSMLALDLDVICGLYPSRDNRREGYFPYRPVTDAAIPNVPVFEILGGPTGFMMIKREVLDLMILKYPEIKTKDVVNDHPVYSFFDTGILFEPGYWYGEDYVFCERFRHLGGKIHGYGEPCFTHVGRSSNTASLMEQANQLKRRPS